MVQIKDVERHVLYNINTYESKPFVFQAATEAELGQIIGCIRQEYGEGYVNPRFYSKAFLADCMAEQTLYFHIALTEDHIVAGTLGLLKTSRPPGGMELCTFIIRPEFRGYGIGGFLAQRGLYSGARSESSGLLTFSLTNHTVSQHVSLKAGLVASGFLFSQYIDHKYEAEPENRSPKLMLAIGAKLVRKKDVGTLYVPIEHKAQAALVYESLGVSHMFGEPSERLSPKSQVQIKSNPDSQTVEIFANACGEDMERVIFQSQEFIADARLKSLNVYLNMHDPSCVLGYRLLHSKCFFFTGFLPVCESGEYLIMHKEFNVRVDFSKIKTMGEYTPFLQYVEMCKKQFRHGEV